MRRGQRLETHRDRDTRRYRKGFIHPFTPSVLPAVLEHLPFTAVLETEWEVTRHPPLPSQIPKPGQI